MLKKVSCPHTHTHRMVYVLGGGYEQVKDVRKGWKADIERDEGGVSKNMCKKG